MNPSTRFLRIRLLGAFLMLLVISLFKPKEMQQLLIDADRMNYLKDLADLHNRRFSESLRREGKVFEVAVKKVNA